MKDGIFGYSESRWSVEIDLDPNKTIDHIVMTINGYDSQRRRFLRNSKRHHILWCDKINIGKINL